MRIGTPAGLRLARGEASLYNGGDHAPEANALNLRSNSRPEWKRTLYAIAAGELLAVAGFTTSTPIIPFYLQDLGSPEYDCPHSSVGPFRITPVHVISDLRPTIGLDENWMRDILKVQPIALFASEDLKQTL